MLSVHPDRAMRHVGAGNPGMSLPNGLCGKSPAEVRRGMLPHSFERGKV